MAKTAAERMAASRARKRNSATPQSATGVAQLERNTPSATGPLDVYSAQRWSFLQSKGHVWDEARRRGVRSGPGSEIVGVTVPGDPGYEGIA